MRAGFCRWIRTTWTWVIGKQECIREGDSGVMRPEHQGDMGGSGKARLGVKLGLEDQSGSCCGILVCAASVSHQLTLDTLPRRCWILLSPDQSVLLQDVTAPVSPDRPAFAPWSPGSVPCIFVSVTWRGSTAYGIYA